jgi:hypothetical protein
VAIALGATCLAVTVGLYARPAAFACACLLVFVAVADRLRKVAFYAAVTMHLCIGLKSGHVKWFALLMISLLVGWYLP